MLYTVRHAGVPVGRVTLAPTELAAAPLIRLPAYHAIEARVRAASQVLLEYGFYGPPILANSDSERRRARIALASGATLNLDLVLIPSGALVPTTFVNLIEPRDGGVIVVVRFREEHAQRAAPEGGPLMTAPELSNPPAS